MFGQEEILGLARRTIEGWTAARLALSLKRERSREPLLLYAGQAPEPDSLPTGGQVKLVHLAKKYPERALQGNILYLITSCLPRGAVAWASAARKKGIKVVVNQNGVAFPAWASRSECERINLRNRRLIENADVVVYQSQFCVEGVKRWVGAEGRSSKILPNYVDPSQFKPLEVPLPGPIQLIAIGSHLRKERVSLAIEALGLLRRTGHDVRLRLVGRFLWPDAQAEMQSWIKAQQLDAYVTLHGSYTQQEAVSHYQSSHILLHLLDKDASPTVPLEAMACGLPVVCLDSGGMPELVTPDTGILLPVTKEWDTYHYPAAQAVADAVQDILPRWSALSIAARKRVETHFAKDRWIERHEEIFADVLR